MASMLRILFMGMCIGLAVPVGIPSSAERGFSEIVKKAWSALEKNFVDPTYRHQG
ncbi:MAG: hypothetical protein LAO21_04890 [Acidobacteriia bacterium]|nr:hypothetical protein [Terriglobia bacterium]